MQQFSSQDWQTGRIREWLLLLLRFAITCDLKDQAAVFAMADEIDALGHQWRPSAPSFPDKRGTARRSARAIIRSEPPFSKSTSHGSTILDCGAPFKLRSTLSKDQRLPLARKRGRTSGQVCGGNRSLPGSVRRHDRSKLAKFAIAARSNHSGRRASRAISDRDRACNGAQAGRASPVRPSSFAKQSLWPSRPSEPRRQGQTPHSRAVDPSEFSHQPRGPMTER
jgi:hypothetical protein